MCGTMRDSRYRIRYDDMQSLGYRSLVHAYYHFDPALKETAAEGTPGKSD
jgi:hypothetical protein